MEQWTCSKLVKEYVEAVYCHLVYLTSKQHNAGWYESQAGIKIARRNINNLIYADDTTLMTESKEDAEAEIPIFWPPGAKKRLI